MGLIPDGAYMFRYHHNKGAHMPQISVSVSQEDYDRASANAKRYGDVSLANAMRKLVTCYAKRVVFFNNLIPEINPARLDEFIMEVYGEEPKKQEKPEPMVSQVDMPTAEFPDKPIDWDHVERELAKDKEKR